MHRCRSSCDVQAVAFYRDEALHVPCNGAAAASKAHRASRGFARLHGGLQGFTGLHHEQYTGHLVSATRTAGTYHHGCLLPCRPPWWHYSYSTVLFVACAHGRNKKEKTKRLGGHGIGQGSWLIPALSRAR